MKRLLKRTLAILMTIVMLIGIAPVAGLTNLLKASAATTYKTGDIIEFGNYPQTEVTDRDLIEKLDKIEKDWTSYKYYSGTGEQYDGKMKSSDFMKYADFFYKGVKYRAVYIEDYRPIYTGWKLGDNSWQDTSYLLERVYYFEFEPLEWRILSASKGFIMCNSIIDSQPYNNTVYKKGDEFFQNSSSNIYASNYEKSSIKKWLNDDFYNTAFSESQKQNILKTKINNDCLMPQYYPEYNSASTTDKIFLLSDNEVTSSTYGFLPSNKYDDAKRLVPTEYAYSQGITCAYYSSRFIPESWILRNATDSLCVAIVEGDGRTSSADYTGIVEAGDTSAGIVPAMCLSELKNDTSMDDETEDERFIFEHSIMADINCEMNISSKGFFNGYFSNEKDISRHRRLIAAKTGDFLNAVKDFSSLNFNINGYQINTNYYDVFLADVFLDMAQSELKDAWKSPAFIDLVGDGVKSLQAIIDPEGTLGFDDDYAKQLTNWIWDNDASLSKSATDKLTDLLKNKESAIKTSKTLGNAFQVVNKAASIVGAVCDIIEAIKKSIQLKAAISYCSQMDSEIFDILLRADTELFKMGAEDFPKELKEYFNISKLSWSSTLLDYSDWFLQSLNDFKATAEGGDEINPDNEMYIQIAQSLFGVLPFQTILTNLTVHGIAKYFTRNLTGEAAKTAMKGLVSKINAALLAGQVTITLTDCLLGLSVTSENYQKTNYSAFIEWALSNLHNTYAQNLINDPTYKNAKTYDNYFTLLKSVETVCFGYCEDFASYKPPISIGRNKEDYARLAGDCSHAKYKWKNQYFCHFTNKTSKGKHFDSIVDVIKTIEDKINAVGAVKELMNSEVNKTVVVACPVNIIVKNNLGQTVLSIVNDQIETCVSPVEANASEEIKVFSLPDTDDYTITITPYDNGTMEYFVSEYQGDSFRHVEFYDIGISKNQKLSGTITDEINQDYTLKQGTKQIKSNVDSKAATRCTDGHTVSNWETVQSSTCSEHGIMKGTCKYCQYVDYIYPERVDHKDNNHDGKCDYCGTALETPMIKSVSVSDITLKCKAYATIIPNISADPGVSYNVKYTSSNTKVATVDKDGKVYGVGVGTATITCTVTDQYGNTVSDTCTVTVKSESTNYQVGDIIEFGSYPQSEVTDSLLKSKLETCSKTWVSYGYYSGTGDALDGKMAKSDYMKYSDFSYNGVKYRAVTFNEYRPRNTGFSSIANSTNQDENGYSLNNIYYFKYEPLKWVVLEPAEGLIMCESIIDSQSFNNYIKNDLVSTSWGNPNKDYYASDFKNCSLRTWLNSTFYDLAFSQQQQSQILETHNQNNSYYSSKYDGESTVDKVFLLSYWDAIYSNYGFNSNREADGSRTANGTDYAKCQGLLVPEKENGKSPWWLRTPYGSSGTKNVEANGSIDAGYETADETELGIRPVIKIHLKQTETSSGSIRSVKTDNISLNYKKSATLNPVITADPGVKYTVKYESSNPKVVTVDKDGNVYGAKKGSADIKVTVTDTAGNTVTDTCKVNVKYSFGQWLIVIFLFGWIWY